MIKASKVVFISEELENDFNSLKIDDPIKKAMVRAIRGSERECFQWNSNTQETFSEGVCSEVWHK